MNFPEGTEYWSGGEPLSAPSPTNPFFKYYGKQYACIPFNSTPYPLYMSKTVFDAAGVDFPTQWLVPNTYTWDEFFPVMQKVTNKLAPKAYGLSLAPGLAAAANQPAGQSWWNYEFNQILWGFGGDFVVEGKNPWTFASGFSTPAAVSAFGVYNDAYNKYKVCAPDTLSFSRNEPEFGNSSIAAGVECSCLWEIIATLGNPSVIEPIVRGIKPFPFPTQQKTPQVMWEVNAQVMFTSGTHPDAGWDFSRALMANQENIWQWTWRQPGAGGQEAANLGLIAQIPGLKPLIYKYQLDKSWWMADVLALEQPPYARRRSSAPQVPTVPQFNQALLDVIQQKKTPQEAATYYDGILNDWLKSQNMYSSA
jgi:ABC-type glycerol-3-phosphate transport system substrate-binding protein